MDNGEDEDDEEDYISVRAGRIDNLRLRNGNRHANGHDHGHAHEHANTQRNRLAHGRPNLNWHLNLPPLPPRNASSAAYVPGPVFQQQPLQPHPNAADNNIHPEPSLDVDSAPSMAPQPVDVPCSSRPFTQPDPSNSKYPVAETSPKGSPGRKYEEFAPSTSNYDRSQPRYRDRRFTPEDINFYTTHGRLATFYVYKWGVPFMDKRLLAKVGFYYEGNGDEVVCSRCGRTLKEWKLGDDPWVEHHNNFDEDCFELES